MLASYQWLRELTGVDATPEQYAEKLTSLGLEVESMQHFDAPAKVVVAEVKQKEKHPKRDKLTIVQVDDGSGELQQVCCGASNVPEVGGKVLFAQLGASLTFADGTTLDIAERKLGGVASRGMICSEDELLLGSFGDGIFVFGVNTKGDGPAPGTPLAEALPVGDVVFEIGLTPNRPDCLGHIGIARDLAAAFGVSFERPAVKTPPAALENLSIVAEADRKALSFEQAPQGAQYDGDVAELLSGAANFEVAIEDGERCPRYGAAFVLGVSAGDSPFWLRYRLHVLGHRSLGALVDATNLVMLESGHPIHGFDLQKLRGGRIEVRQAKEGESLTTLDEAERSLVADDLLICDGEGPVALAGVMGGANSEIGDGTQHVAIECAYFNPRSVRRTSRRTGLHTDASHRFERGVDPNDVPWVLSRAAALIAEVGGGVVVADAIDLQAKDIAPAKIQLRHDRVEKLLGVSIDADIARKVLTSLGCTITAESEEALWVEAPTWRPDLLREVDLIEEVARIHGYDHIPTRMPRVHPTLEGTAATITFERRLREAGVTAGLFEAVNFSFVSTEELAAARASTETVALANPLSEERSVMRTSLLPGLAKAAGHALRRQAGEVALFELGRTFAPGQELLPVETPMFGAFVAGRTRDWIGAERDLDTFDLKGYVEALVDAATGRQVELVVPEDDGALHPALHPRRQAKVKVAGEFIGHLGELHPEVGDAFDLDFRGQYAELDVHALRRAADAAGEPQASAPPRYPAVSRDIALLVDEAHTAAEVAEVLRGGGGELVESVTLFDLYRGDSLPEGKKSLALRLVYRDAEGTLTDKRVDKAHNAAAKAAKKKLGATPR